MSCFFPNKIPGCFYPQDGGESISVIIHLVDSIQETTGGDITVLPQLNFVTDTNLNPVNTTEGKLVHGACACWQVVGPCKCYGGEAEEISYSLPDGAGTEVSGGIGSSDASQTGNLIKFSTTNTEGDGFQWLLAALECLESNSPVTLIIIDQDGEEHEFIADSGQSSGNGVSFAGSGEFGVGFKLRGGRFVCGTEGSEACREVRCIEGENEYRWVDIFTGEKLTEEQISTLEECPPLCCDGEVVIEPDPCWETEDLTVSRPDDTPNVGWNNELLQSPSLSGDQKLEFTVSAATGNTPQMIGFSDTDTNDSYTDLDYAFYVYTANGNFTLQIRESAALVLNVPGGWAVGDTLCIWKTGTVVYYFKNNTLVHTSTVPSTTDLEVGSSFYFNNGFWSSGSITLADISVCPKTYEP